MIQFQFGFVLGLILVLPAAAVVDQWTPASFNWTALPMNDPATWKGLYLNLSDPDVTVSREIMAMGDVRLAGDQSTVLAIPFVLGALYQVFNLALTGIGLAGTISGCRQTEGKADNILYCVGGLVSTIVGVGGVASAAKNLAKSRGYLGVAANAWDNSGLERIALDTFSRRGLDDYDYDDDEAIHQKAHNYIVHSALRSLAVDGAVSFVGYAPESHTLARRQSSEHPLAPMFAFTHVRHGPMELTSRDSGAALHLTVSYAGHPTHHGTNEKRDEYYRKERLSSGLMEGRFDSAASKADAASISFDGAAAFGQIEREVQCTMGRSWPGQHVLSIQMYDQAHQATFGFASIGMFQDSSVNQGLENFAPRGMPLPSKGKC